MALESESDMDFTVSVTSSGAEESDKPIPTARRTCIQGAEESLEPIPKAGGTGFQGADRCDKPIPTARRTCIQGAEESFEPIPKTGGTGVQGADRFDKPIPTARRTCIQEAEESFEPIPIAGGTGIQGADESDKYVPKAGNSERTEELYNVTDIKRFAGLMSEEEQVRVAKMLSLGEDVAVQQSYSVAFQQIHSGYTSSSSSLGDVGLMSQDEDVSVPKWPSLVDKFVASSESEDDSAVEVVSESHPCKHCNAVFSSKSQLQKHMKAVNLAAVLKPKSVGLKETGASYIPDSWIKPVYSTTRRRSPSPISNLPKKKKRKISKQTQDRHEPQDWHVLNDLQSSDGSVPDSESEEREESDLSETEKKSFKKWTVLKSSKSKFFKNSTSVARSIIHPDISKVNFTVPANCGENHSFLINTMEMNRFDITCDDTGKYHRPSYSKKQVEVDDEHYILVRKYYRHKDSPFKRTIYQITKNDKALPNVIIRYEWIGKKSTLIIKPHGNTKNPENAQPYIRTKPSVLKSLKETGTSNTKRRPAQQIISTMFDKEGGSEGISSFSDVPRDAKQVYRHASRPESISDFSELIRLNLKGDYVKTVEFVDGKPRVFLCLQEQADDIIRFCCKSNAILSIDPTYDLGPFLLTATTFRHPMYVNKENGMNVLMPGPMLLHCKRDWETYAYLGQRLSIVLKNQTVQFFGTDGEKALVKGLQSTTSFKGSNHLLCMLHHRQNCERKLQSLGVRKNKNRILRMIYGEQVENTRYQGLADSTSEDNYDENLKSYQTVWDQLEHEETQKAANFSAWFKKYKSDDVKESMLKTMRQKAGLGEEPKQFTTNDCESLNSLIKKSTKGQSQTWEKMSSILQNLVDSKYKELVLAVHGTESRQLSESFKHLELTNVQWLGLTGDQRREHLKKVHLSRALDEYNLSVDVEESGIGGFTSAELNQVWEKAGCILAKQGGILKVPPPNENTHMVFTNEGNVFKVTKKPGNMFECEKKCRSFKFYDSLLCEHTLAVADHSMRLVDYISSVNSKKRSSTVSLVNKLIHIDCDGAGKKIPQNKRKGYNNTIAQTVQNVVPPAKPALSKTVTSNTQPISTVQPFSVCLKSALVRICYGCGTPFSEKMNRPPNDLILKRFDHREYKNKTTGEMARSYRLENTYYHLDMNCVRRRHPYTQVKDILVYNELQVTEEHIAKLRKFGVDVNIDAK